MKVSSTIFLSLALCGRSALQANEQQHQQEKIVNHLKKIGVGVGCFSIMGYVANMSLKHAPRSGFRTATTLAAGAAMGLNAIVVGVESIGLLTKDELAIRYQTSGYDKMVHETILEIFKQ